QRQAAEAAGRDVGPHLPGPPLPTPPSRPPRARRENSKENPCLKVGRGLSPPARVLGGDKPRPYEILPRASPLPLKPPLSRWAGGGRGRERGGWGSEGLQYAPVSTGGGFASAGAGVHPRRQVRDRPAPRQRRHGRGLPRAPRPPAGAAGGQDPAPGPGGGSGGAEAVHARGPPRHPDQASQRRHPL